MAKAMSTTVSTNPNRKLASIKKRPRRVILLAFLVLLIGGTGLFYFIQARQAAAATATTAPQTAIVR